MSANDVIGLVVVTDENSPVEIFNVPLVLNPVKTIFSVALLKLNTPLMIHQG